MKFALVCFLVSTYVVCERLSVMHKQVSVQLTSNSKFLSKFSRKPLSGISDQRAPPPCKTDNFEMRFEMTKVYSKILTPPQMKNFRFEITKVNSKIPPPPLPNEKLQIWDDQNLLRNTPSPQNEKLQIWGDQSLLQNTPLPQWKNFRFEMTKVYSKILPPSNEKL